MIPDKFRCLLFLTCSVFVARILYWLIDEFAWGKWVAFAVLGGLAVCPLVRPFMPKGRLSKTAQSEYRWSTPLGKSTQSSK
jgi:hypothetical protein